MTWIKQILCALRDKLASYRENPYFEFAPRYDANRPTQQETELSGYLKFQNVETVL